MFQLIHNPGENCSCHSSAGQMLLTSNRVLDREAWEAAWEAAWDIVRRGEGLIDTDSNTAGARVVSDKEMFQVQKLYVFP